MNATEVIEQIKKLSPEERRVAAECLRSERAALIHAAPVAVPSGKFIPHDRFVAAKKRVFAGNRELLARLAK